MERCSALAIIVLVLALSSLLKVNGQACPCSPAPCTTSCPGACSACVPQTNTCSCQTTPCSQNPQCPAGPGVQKISETAAMCGYTETVANCDYSVSCDTTTCTSCNANYYFSSSTCLPCAYNSGNCPSGPGPNILTSCSGGTVNVDTSSCTPCNSPCSQCTSTTSTCTQCVQNYYLTGSTCTGCAHTVSNCPSSTAILVTCPGGAGTSDSSSCTACVSPCSQCSGATTTCTQCISGYYLSGSTCKACAHTSSNCASGVNILVTCPGGTATSDTSSCTPCQSPCTHCSGTTSSCTQCVADMYLGGSTCIMCAYNTANCPAPPNTLTACPGGSSTVDTSSCLACTFPCSACVQPTSCTACQPNYFLVASTCSACAFSSSNCPNGNLLTACPGGVASRDNSACAACLSPCLDCANTTSTCTTCVADHYLVHSACQPCAYNAGNCPSGVSVLTTCASGNTGPDTSSCTACVFPCSRCSTSPTTCTQCVSGYQLTTASNCTAIVQPPQPPSIDYLSPSVSSPFGHTLVTIYGHFFDSNCRAMVNSFEASLYSASSSTGSSSQSNQTMWLSFYSPSAANLSIVDTGGFYAVVNVVNPSSNMNASQTAYLYYPPLGAAACGLGTFLDGSACVPCPSGGFCPGGGRVWPLIGYWSINEHVPPQACSFYEACPGVNQTSPQLNQDGSVDTAMCSDGWTGQFCSQCATGYYVTSGFCRPCGANPHSELVAVLFIGAGLFGLMAIAAATMSDAKMGTAVAAIVTFQQVSVVGGIAATQVPNTGAAAFFLYLSLLNLDVDVIKPGCSGSVLPFVQLFWYTIAFVVCAAAVFLSAAAIRARTASDETVKALGVTRSKLFKRRAIHSLIILGFVAYLQVTLRVFQGIICAKAADGQNRLRADLSLVCYSDFVATAFFLFLILIFYVIGFPLLCLYLVYRGTHNRSGSLFSRSSTKTLELPPPDTADTSTSHSQATSPETAVTTDDIAVTTRPAADSHAVIHPRLHDPKRAGKYGFLYRGVKDKDWAYRMVSFFTSFLLALQQALAPSIALKTFLSVLTFGVNIIGIGLLLPFKHWANNAQAFILGTAAVVQVLVYLAVLAGPDVGDRWPLFDATLALLLAMLTVVGVFRLYRSIQRQGFSEWWSSFRQCGCCKAQAKIEDKVSRDDRGQNQVELVEVQQS